MLITLLQREEICTVLPPSAVHRELSAGELCAHTIIDPEVERRMFAIYSGERSLTAPERQFVSLLRGFLADTRALDAPALDAPEPFLPPAPDFLPPAAAVQMAF
jgi:DNA-binding transcriptional LysR family regulator